jgi:hypothetical protein
MPPAPSGTSATTTQPAELCGIRLHPEKRTPTEADALYLPRLSQLTVMTGHVGRVVFRAPIAVRIRILVDLTRTTFRSRVLNAGSVVGHGGRESDEVERE